MKRFPLLTVLLVAAMLLSSVAAVAAPAPAVSQTAPQSPALDVSSAPPVQEAPPDKEASQADCALLDDPAARDMMSGMFETKLLNLCGRTNELGRVASSTPERAPQVGVDVLVNDPAPEVNASSRTQSETSIALNENTGTICSGYNDSYSGVVQGLGYTGFSNSTDGGATFVDRGALGAASFGDPSVFWRRADGLFYLGTIHSSGMGLWRSNDDCETMTFVGTPHVGSGDDKELFAVDNFPGSPYYGRIYMAWTNFNVGGGTIQAIYSDDASTWSSPVNLSNAGTDVQGAWPYVAPNGDVYVAWVRWNPYPSGNIDVEIVKSTNGGVSWSFVTNPMSNQVNPRAAAPTASCGRPALNGNIRYLPSPQIAVTPNGDLHVVYSYDPDGYNTGDVVNVYYRRSTDGGATWGPEFQLNDDATTNDQWFPSLSAGPTGRVVAAWYDRRADANNFDFTYWMRVSDDGGTTWAPSFQVSDVPSGVVLDPNLATCYHGDYDQQVQDASSGYIQWSDDRTVQSTDPNV
ncbi:MAG: hypothetical protein ACK2U9_14625, partial [Anaerolineae bacterium]